MKKIFLFAALNLCVAGAAVAAEVNLVRNPGFEGKSVIADSADGGWWLSEGSGKTEAKVDGTVARNGKASLRLRAEAEAKSVVVGPKFEVAPGDELRFEVWAKTADAASNGPVVHGGLAFRNKGGNVMERAYFNSKPLTGEWTLISGTARVPAEAVTAEAHLGYTNSPAPVWYDDVFAAITSPISFSLVEGAKHWAGPQEITVRVANRQSTALHGSVSCTIGKEVSNLAVALAPDTARDFRLPITLTGVRKHEYKIALLDATTSAATLRELQGKFVVNPPLELFPAVPCYQIAGQGDGGTRIDARLNVNPVMRAGLKLAVEISDANGKQIRSATKDAASGEFTGVELRVPVDQPALFAVTARLIDRGGKVLGEEKTDIHVTAADEARVLTGPDGFLRINGSPNFPIGLYNSGHTEEMGKAGFTATHNYEITTGEADEAINPNEADLKGILDKSWANGMRMMVELPRKAIEKGKWAQVRRRIETFKHHPGLLCWGSEERVARGTTSLTNITALYKIIHELDPDHPFVLGDSRDVIQKFKGDRRDFFADDDMDAGIWWWYPIPLTTADGNGLDGAGNSTSLMTPPTWLTTTHSQKPLWIAIQAYQKSAREARFPTPAEYRCQCYLSIINGVKAIWFYVGSGQKDYLGKSAGLLNKPEESHWDYVQKLVRELREFSPVIVSPKSGAQFTMSPENAPVEFTTRQSGGNIYLIAANKSGMTQKVSFTGDTLKDAKVKVLYEEHPVTVEGNALADEFSAFGVHVYELDVAK